MPTYNPDQPDIGGKHSQTLSDWMSNVNTNGISPEAARKMADAIKVLAIKNEPKRTHDPTYNEAVTLVGNVRRIRDSINRELIRFYSWADVRNMPLAKQIDLLQSLGLQFSATASLPSPVTLRPLDAPSSLPSDSLLAPPAAPTPPVTRPSMSTDRYIPKGFPPKEQQLKDIPF